jgi:hypothetical protein
VLPAAAALPPLRYHRHSSVVLTPLRCRQRLPRSRRCCRATAALLPLLPLFLSNRQIWKK